LIVEASSMRVASTIHWPFGLSARKRHLAEGVWRLVDPKIALASLIPFGVGVALAADQHPQLDWLLALSAFAAIFLVEVGKNAVNDLYDFRSGADTEVRPDERSPFSGGKRVLVDHLLKENDLVIIAWIAFGAAALIGSEIASRSKPALLVLGACAAVISILYAAPPIKLSSRGLGELAVGAVYGPGIVIGTLLLLRGSITLEVLVVAMTFGLLIANVLLMNEIPDERADRVAGKRTLVVRFGRDRTETLVIVLFTIAFLVPAVVASYGLAPFRLNAFLAAVPSAVFAVSGLRTTRHGPPVIAQTLTLVTYVIAGIAVATAVWFL
jgi:1,4-dihydroxy-2-naphthoate octaprenyltransferase